MNVWDGGAVVQLGGGHAPRPTLMPAPGRRSEEPGTLPVAEQRIKS